MYKFLRNVIFKVFVVNWPSAKFWLASVREQDIVNSYT